MRLTACFTAVTYLAFTLFPPDALAVLQPASRPWLSGVPYTDVRAYDPTTGTLPAATQAQAAKAYWVRTSAAATWTPPLPKNVTTSFVFDGDGGKVKQITASGTTTYLGEVYEKDSAGKTTKYVFAGSLRIANKSSDGELLFYHTDHLGSSDVVTNTNGQMVEHTEHLPYGAISRHDGPKDLPHKFTGQRQDTTNGLVLFPARAYDPELGRFLQADPFVGSAASPQSLNRYSYALNNPVRYTDPSGNFVFLAALLFVAASAVVAGAIGAVINTAVAAATGNIHNFRDFFRAAGTGFAAGAAAGATGALGALILGPAISGTLLGSMALGAGSGAVGGGVGSVLGGGSFGQGAGWGALTGGALAGVGHVVGPALARTSLGQALNRTTQPITSRLSNLYSQALAPRSTGINGVLTRAQNSLHSGLVRFNNRFFEPIPSGEVGNFGGGQYLAHKERAGGYLYRVEGERYGGYYTRTKPQSAAHAMRDSNIPWASGNDMTEVSAYLVTKSMTVYEGPVAGGQGGQIYIAPGNRSYLEWMGSEPLPAGGGP